MRRTPRTSHVRLAVAKILFLAIFLVIGGRAFYLQALQGDRLMRLGQRQHLKQSTVLPKRGGVYDRAGEALALSLEAQSVYARPGRIKDLKKSARDLARILKISTAEIKERLTSGKPFVWIKRQISPSEAGEIQNLKIEGVGMFHEPHRYYPQGQLAGQVIGFVGRDAEGLEGLELRYNEYIRGETGSSVSERDALGRRVLVEGVEGLQIPAGGDIHLTLDTSIQHLAEKELEASIDKYRARAGVAIAVEPRTGEILALANYPTFNPNNYSSASPEQRRNRAVTDSFEPGSTFKTILAAAALEEGIVEREDLFFCEYGKFTYAGKIIHDSHPHGWLPFSKILQVSSNIGFSKVADKLKKDRFFKYIEKFGFGQVTGIDMPGEAPGLLRRPETWSAIDLATHAFGQGLSATPLQMVMAYAAIANGGFLMRPYVVRRALSPKGEVLVENQPHVVRRVISERTARSLASMLQEVTTEGGTGMMAKVEGFDVAGKTGTAQKVDLVNGGYDAKKRVASFVGFVPADEPRLVLMVLVDEPQSNVYGGVVAAPAFQNIARGALRHFGIAAKTAEPIAAPLVEADIPLRRVPRRNGEAAVDSGATPDFVGLSLREAVEKARDLNLKVKIHGNGYVIKQSPSPGGRWVENGMLVLNLQG
jgi:cell division protein FtsI (penicillin-binding protein 3)